MWRVFSEEDRLSRGLSWKLAAASKAHVRQVLVPDELNSTEMDWDTVSDAGESGRLCATSLSSAHWKPY